MRRKEITELFDPNTFPIIKTGFDALRAALGAAKDVKDLVKDGPTREAAEKKLDEAERRVSELAQAQIAQALGYKLCQCSFPPKIMLMKGRHMTRGVEIYSCPSCQNQVQSDFEFRQMDRNDAAVNRHNQGEHSWMGT